MKDSSSELQVAGKSQVCEALIKLCWHGAMSMQAKPEALQCCTCSVNTGRAACTVPRAYPPVLHLLSTLSVVL